MNKHIEFGASAMVQSNMASRRTLELNNPLSKASVAWAYGFSQAYFDCSDSRIGFVARFGEMLGYACAKEALTNFESLHKQLTSVHNNSKTRSEHIASTFNGVSDKLAKDLTQARGLISISLRILEESKKSDPSLIRSIENVDDKLITLLQQITQNGNPNSGYKPSMIDTIAQTRIFLKDAKPIFHSSIKNLPRLSLLNKLGASIASYHVYADPDRRHKLARH